MRASAAVCSTPARSAAEAIDRERVSHPPRPSGSIGAGRPPDRAWAAAVRRARRRSRRVPRIHATRAGQQRQEGDRAGDGRPGGADRPGPRGEALAEDDARRPSGGRARPRRRRRAASSRRRPRWRGRPPCRRRPRPRPLRPGRSACARARPGRAAARSRPWPRRASPGARRAGRVDRGGDAVGGGREGLAGAVDLAADVEPEGQGGDQAEHDRRGRDRRDRGPPRTAWAGVVDHVAAGLRPGRAKVLPPGHPRPGRITESQARIQGWRRDG